jgi:hypothetical protein
MECLNGGVVLRMCVTGGVLFSLVAMAPKAYATNFAVLFQQPSGNGGSCGSDVDGVNLFAQGAFEQLPSGIWRMRKRPEVLYQEWDSTIADYITTNPLYEGGNTGENPLFESAHLSLIPNILEMSITPDAIARTWQLSMSMEVIARPVEFGGTEAYALVNFSQMIETPSQFRMPQVSDFFATRSLFFGVEGMRIRNVRSVSLPTDPDAGFSVMGGSWNVSFVPSPGAAGLTIAGALCWGRRRR